MYQWFYQGSDLLNYPLLGMCLFIAVFAVAVARALARSRRPGFEATAVLPLEEEHHAKSVFGDRHE